MKVKLSHSYKDLISIENLLSAWQEFLEGKRHKEDVQEFQFNLMDNILSLYYDLSNNTYKHGGYQVLKINDPKPRTIHKAGVRDRLLHHAVYRILYPFFNKTFTADSFSCRKNKGTHKAINRFREFAYIVSKNNTRTCWILKCDIKKFFHSIDQKTLIKILENYISDTKIMNLLKNIIFSFSSDRLGKGLPLGNLTSQLFCNVYMNEFDQFLKHNLKVKYYIRYADDFVIFSDGKNYLKENIQLIGDFLQNRLGLTLHPSKVYVKTLCSGIDFLGWINFFNHRVLRTNTQRKMFKRLNNNSAIETLNSYLGLISHGNSYKVKTKLLNQIALAAEMGETQMFIG